MTFEINTNLHLRQQTAMYYSNDGDIEEFYEYR